MGGEASAAIPARAQEHAPVPTLSALLAGLDEVEDMEELGFKLGHRRLLQAALSARNDGQAPAVASPSLGEPALGNRIEQKPAKKRLAVMEREPYNFRRRREAEQKRDMGVAEHKVACNVAAPVASARVRYAQKTTPEHNQKQKLTTLPDDSHRVEILDHCSPPKLGEVADVIKVEEDVEVESKSDPPQQDDSRDLVLEPSIATLVRPGNMPGIVWCARSKSWRISARKADGRGRISVGFRVGKFTSSARTQNEAINAARKAAITRFSKLLRSGVVNEVVARASGASSSSTVADGVPPKACKLAANAQGKVNAKRPRDPH